MIGNTFEINSNNNDSDNNDDDGDYDKYDVNDYSDDDDYDDGYDDNDDEIGGILDVDDYDGNCGYETLQLFYVKPSNISCITERKANQKLRNSPNLSSCDCA